MFQRSPSSQNNNLPPFSSPDDAQSTRSNDTPVTSQSNTNSSQNADNNSEAGKPLFFQFKNIKKNKVKPFKRFPQDILGLTKMMELNNDISEFEQLVRIYDG